jgi:hypothetical protein
MTRQRATHEMQQLAELSMRRSRHQKNHTVSDIPPGLRPFGGASWLAVPRNLLLDVGWLAGTVHDT